jgi:hypothetical protein
MIHFSALFKELVRQEGPMSGHAPAEGRNAASLTRARTKVSICAKIGCADKGSAPVALAQLHECGG